MSMPACGFCWISVSDVVAIHLDADRLLEGDRARLMRRLFEHRREAEELAAGRLVDDHVLMVLVDRRHPHRARHHDVGAPAGSPIL